MRDESAWGAAFAPQEPAREPPGGRGARELLEWLLVFTAVLLTAAGLGAHRDLIIIGALMALVPGIAMTNAMRDIMAGDMVAGISKAAEALLIGAAIALGTALALGLTRMVTGGAL